jgi:hypothetical protein
VSKGESIIAEYRDSNSSCASLVLDILHISSIRELEWNAPGVFIFGLVKNDRTAMGNLGLGYDGTNTFNVAASVING